MFSLVGCELLGIETTTIKGNWMSEKFEDGYYCCLLYTSPSPRDS